MVVVFALGMVAEVQAMTTEAFLEQAFAKAPGTKDVQKEEAKAERSKANATKTKTDNPKKGRANVAKREADKPKLSDVKELLGQVLAEAFSPTLGQQLIDPDKRVLVDLMDFTGMPQSKVLDAIAQAGLTARPKLIYDYSDTVPAGYVIGQEPKPGTSLEPDSTVTLVVAQTEIAVQPGTEEDIWTGSVVAVGQQIVHRPFDVELVGTGIRHIPMFSIGHEGRHHPRGEKDYDLLEVRAKSIAARLSKAWDLMDEGGYLEIADDTSYDLPDDVPMWRIRGPFRPDYHEFQATRDALEIYPAIYVRHDRRAVSPLRIMTVYPDDARLFGSPRGTDKQGNIVPIPFNDRELAEYLVALIKAHYLLFCKKSTQIEDYDALEICRTREGKIFKEICIRAGEAAGRHGIPELQDALARIAMSQRARLTTLAFKAPSDWRFRGQ